MALAGGSSVTAACQRSRRGVHTISLGALGASVRTVLLDIEVDLRPLAHFELDLLVFVRQPSNILRQLSPVK